jgi:phosphoenolpyruvate-protein phosphotransferase (PTS system enzyme I)
MKEYESICLSGIGVSPGVAIGPALLFQPKTESALLPDNVSRPANQAVEKKRLQIAVTAAIAELHDLAEQVAREIGRAEAGIFVAQALMLEDPTITERAGELIDQESATAEVALQTAAEEQAALLAALPDPLWQGRAADVRDAMKRSLSHLASPDSQGPTLAKLLAGLTEPVVVVANDLMPSDTVQMRVEQVCAIALVKGNATAHAAILARGLGIPAVMGVGNALLEATHERDMLLVDGTSGKVLVQPTAAELEQGRYVVTQQRALRQAATAQQEEWRLRPGQTRDEYLVPLLANVGTVADARAAGEMGAEGIGLLRTEFLFSDRAILPDEEEQAALYEGIISTFSTSLGTSRQPITIRTLDVGADKPLPSLEPYLRDLPSEENPALGVRGIRLQLFAKDLLITQLRAVVQATMRTRANVRIMLPMIAVVEELREAHSLLLEAFHALVTEGSPVQMTSALGMMVETPAAVLAIDALAREASFLSIGTNDLTQYVMAADRLSPALTKLCQPTQPPVLHAIANIVEGAHSAGRHVGVCGEMAGDPRLALLLVGLGVDELSMTPTSIPGVKQALTTHSIAELRSLAAAVLRATTIAEVEQTITAALD